VPAAPFCCGRSALKTWRTEKWCTKTWCTETWHSATWYSESGSAPGPESLLHARERDCVHRRGRHGGVAKVSELQAPLR